jgi:hypothetical protein
MLKEKGLTTGDQKHMSVDYSPALMDYSPALRRSIELFVPTGIRVSAAARVRVKMLVLGHRGVERVGSNGFWPL